MKSIDGGIVAPWKIWEKAAAGGYRPGIPVLFGSDYR